MVLPHRKENPGNTAKRKAWLIHRAQRLERPRSHMWGMLRKKIKIMGENTPGTVKPQTIWSFIVTGRGEISLIEKSPLQSITAACSSQYGGQEMKDRGEPWLEPRRQHLPLQAQPKDPSSSAWVGASQRPGPCRPCVRLRICRTG